MATHIDKIGFELEGGWAGTAGISPFKDISLIQDGSINGQTLVGERIRAVHVGEAVSPPIPIADMTGDPPKAVWEVWLTSHWPDATPPDRTNNTCGFHIHLSLLTYLDYSLMTSRKALFLLRDAIKAEGEKAKLPKKHEFWARMEGLNTFCNFFTDPAKQMSINSKRMSKDRYGFLNFSYGVHGTMEFRALPTFRDAHVAVGFTEAYLAAVDKWLDENQPTEPLIRRESFRL